MHDCRYCWEGSGIQNAAECWMLNAQAREIHTPEIEIESGFRAGFGRNIAKFVRPKVELILLKSQVNGIILY